VDDAKKVTIRNNETTQPRPIKYTDKDNDKNTEANGQEKADGDKTAKQPEKTAQPEISKKEKNRLCNEAKSDLAAIDSRGRMREKNASGEYVYLSEKQRQQRLDAARKKQREFCR
jgi:hypothetical protein